jgi:hypothetical protein
VKASPLHILYCTFRSPVTVILHIVLASLYPANSIIICKLLLFHDTAKVKDAENGEAAVEQSEGIGDEDPLLAKS